MFIFIIITNEHRSPLLSGKINQTLQVLQILSVNIKPKLM